MKTSVVLTKIGKQNNSSYVKKGSQPALIRESNKEVSILINFPHLIRGNCYIDYDNRNITVHPGFSRFSKGDHNVCLRLGKDVDIAMVKPELKGRTLRIIIPKKVRSSDKPLKKAA